MKIGFSMALTGPLGPAGKAALLAMQIWRDDVNAKGGLLGRKVKLVYYDDQTKPANVPGIYAKLLDVDKVDFIVSGYGTNLIVPALPIAMERGMVFMGLFGLDANAKFKYNNYFQIMPAGPDPIVDWSRGFLNSPRNRSPVPRRSRCSRPMRNSRATPWPALAGTRRNTASRSSTTSATPSRHIRFHADSARCQGHEPRSVLRGLLSGRFGGHREGRT